MNGECIALSKLGFTIKMTNVNHIFFQENKCETIKLLDYQFIKLNEEKL